MALDGIDIAVPCKASWEDMKGDARVRFCGACKLNVYNLSEMGRTEAEALVQKKEGRLCVRFYHRPDGTVLTKDCSLLVRARHQANLALAAGVAALLTLTAWAGSFLPSLLSREFLAWLTGKARVEQRPMMGTSSRPPQALQGKVAVPIQGDVAAPSMGEAVAPSLDSPPGRF